MQLVTDAGFTMTRTRRAKGWGLTSGVEAFAILTDLTVLTAHG